MGLNGEKHVYVGFLKEIDVHIGKCESISSYNNVRDCEGLQVLSKISDISLWVIIPSTRALVSFEVI
jgi:hypothetical protein